ncbi:MAG TPA: NUDIX domain-containing protein [Acidimicrobiales bacterium]|nr:NUDIX domain-containing protein [Acidimicrobiales bacterium]
MADQAALVAALDGHRPISPQEETDVARIRALLDRDGTDPWSRDLPMHVTASALVLHPPTGRVLLRWHERMGSWLQVGGHADPGEDDPVAIALREATEETGLDDLARFPDREADRLVHVVVVPVPAGKGEPAHEHADLRYLFTTEHPDEVVPESATASLRWLTLDAARSVVREDNLRVTLARAGVMLQLRSEA